MGRYTLTSICTYISKLAIYVHYRESSAIPPCESLNLLECGLFGVRCLLHEPVPARQRSMPPSVHLFSLLDPCQVGLIMEHEALLTAILR